RWSWENGAWENGEWKHGEVPAPDQPPLHSRTTDGPGVWGMATTLLANGSLYFSLLFGWLFLWTVAPQWQVPDEQPLPAWPLFGSGLLLTGATAWLFYVVRRLRQREDSH